MEYIKIFPEDPLRFSETTNYLGRVLQSIENILNNL